MRNIFQYKIYHTILRQKFIIVSIHCDNTIHKTYDNFILSVFYVIWSAFSDNIYPVVVYIQPGATFVCIIKLLRIDMKRDWSVNWTKILPFE